MWTWWTFTKDHGPGHTIDPAAIHFFRYQRGLLADVICEQPRTLDAIFDNDGEDDQRIKI